jgi:hypothetical protein
VARNYQVAQEYVSSLSSEDDVGRAPLDEVRLDIQALLAQAINRRLQFGLHRLSFKVPRSSVTCAFSRLRAGQTARLCRLGLPLMRPAG